MFHARMKDYIRTEIGDTNIVTIDNRRCSKSDAKLCEKGTNPIDFRSSSGILGDRILDVVFIILCLS